MTALRLLAWSDKEERRRRAARRGLGKLPPLAWSVLAAVALGAEMARRIDAGTPGSASELWVAAAIAGFAVVIFGAPFRMYWRYDSAFLGRLAIDGAALYRLALIRSARAAVRVLIPCVAGALAFGFALDWSIALRHLVLAGTAAAAAAALGPAVAMFAGAMIASDRTMALVESVAGGEIGAPKTTWLGMFPGIAATAVAASLLAGARWIAGDSMTAIGDPRLLFGLALGIPLVMLVTSWRAARRAMIAAVREVAALDQVRLAHVELSTPSAVERGWSTATIPVAARAVFHKDAKLSRRRYPAPYFLSAVGVVSLWIVAATVPENLVTWTGSLLGCLAAYTVIMARRLATPPVEHPRWLATLAVAKRHVAAAKRSAVALRVASTLALGGVPIIFRAPDPAPMAIAVGAVIAVSAAIAMRSASPA